MVREAGSGQGEDDANVSVFLRLLLACVNGVTVVYF